MRTNANLITGVSALIFVALAAIPLGRTHAVTITTGCAFATVCDMQELLAGGTIQVDDKLFNNFRNYSSVATGGAEEIFANLIQVTDYKVFGGFGIDPAEIGLVFFEFGAATAQGTFLEGGQTQLTSWDYTVTSLGPPIIDNTLLMSGGGFADVPDGASLLISEMAVSQPVTGGPPTEVANKSVFENQSGLQTVDHRDFAPQGFLDISTIMDLNGGIPNTGTNTQILFLVESFSQEIQRAPEPTTLALVGLGLVGVGFARRRRLQ